ncbi:HTH_Tnp_Tc3_2 domain-containing protein [Trichonephila clavipes]|nr:HTH_Tnp_Tc3_2 domain-containing protein [Trichonephila clavipes]
MERIVRPNDESVREGYVRNDGKEVKLFTSALKAFQCNSRIVMAQMKHLDDFLRGRIIGRLECGRIQLEVSDELGIAQSVFYTLWQRFQDDDNVSRCYSTGRPRVKTPNEDRFLTVAAKRNRQSTASDLSHQLSSATGTTVSKQTVNRRLGHIGLYQGWADFSRVRATSNFFQACPMCSTYRNSLYRLQLTWSREHALWTPQQWSCVMFSEESRFSLQSDSRRTLIWRVPGTRYHQENTIERHRYGGAGWLAFGEELFLVLELNCMFRVIWNRFLKTGSAGRRPGQGRRQVTTPNEDRYLVLTARRDQNMNATLLQQHLLSGTGTTVSTQSVRNRLHGVVLYARRPMVCVRLTSRHRRDRRSGQHSM